MRIWLIADPFGAAPCGLETALEQTASNPSEEHELVGVRPASPCLVREIRAQQVDALIIPDAAWPEEPALGEILATGVSILVVTTAERCEHYQVLAQVHPLWFIPPCPTSDTLRLALVGLAACARRQSDWKTQLAGLQQRLSDRIVIERAKGVLVQRLGISEEEAYQRLRLSSRRQRRQIRDIAQSLLDTQALLLPEQNGSVHHSVLKGSEVGGCES